MVKDFNTEQVLHLAFTGGDNRRKISVNWFTAGC